MNEQYESEAKAALERMVAETTCPACGHESMELSWRLKAKEVGTFSLSGAQMKFSANEIPVIRCPGCGIEAEGNLARRRGT